MDAAKNIELILGNLAYVGDRPPLEMELSIITYDAASAQIKNLSNIDELSQYQDDSKISWINVSGLKDIDSIKNLGMMHDIHSLTMEDIVHTNQQPKVEIFEDYRFLSLKTIQKEKHFHHDRYRKKKSLKFFGRNKEKVDEIDEFIIDQVSIIIKKNVLITFQEIHGDPFNNVRKKILEGFG
jgi:magnesium transporter